MHHKWKLQQGAYHCVMHYCTLTYTCSNLKLDTQSLPGMQQEILHEELIDVGCVK